MTKKKKYGKNFKCLVVFLVLLFLMGCASIPLLSNIPQVADNRAIGKLYVGPFIDIRNFPDFDTKVIGVQCGSGNIFCRKGIDERGADEFVREHLINTARASSVFADRTPDVLVEYKNDKWIINRSPELQNDKIILVGFISKLEYFQGMGTALNIDINLELLDPGTGKTMWSSKLKISKGGDSTLGLIAGTDRLKSWLAKNLQDEALKVFSSNEFQNIIKSLSRY